MIMGIGMTRVFHLPDLYRMSFPDVCPDCGIAVCRQLCSGRHCWYFVETSCGYWFCNHPTWQAGARRCSCGNILSEYVLATFGDSSPCGGYRCKKAMEVLR